MSAPDRPTREQVEAVLWSADQECTEGTRVGILAAEVRALRAELDALSDEDRAEQIAALIVDKVRAQVARTPQPAALAGARVLHEPYPSMVPPQCRTCVDVDEEPSLWPCATAAALGADPSSPYVAPWGAPLPAVPDGEDEPDWHNMRERLHTEIGAIVGVTPREERTGDADGDLIEMVRRAVWAPSPATASDGDDVPARLDAAADALAAISPAWETTADYFRMAAEELREGPWPEDVRAAVAAALALPTGGKTNG